jgi:hypothetical protein
MSFNFVFERFVDGKPYPNLAPVIDMSQGYSRLELEYPRIIPLRLLYYCQDHSYPYKFFDCEQDFPSDSFFPVGIAWFNNNIDYFSLLSDKVKSLCKNKKLRILFYYHEGDNPYHQKKYLDELCAQHGLPQNCYCFISANTQADNIPGFVFFPDHELFYWRCSKDQPILPSHTQPRTHRFTVLSRRHQSWRAVVMSWLKFQRVLEQSFWSYNTIDLDPDIDINRVLDHCPIRVYPGFPALVRLVPYFLRNAPYACDSFTDEQHNTHDLLIEQHFTQSYCNLVLETMFDADQSGGVFLTEKTFKPIRHAQPFVIFGCAGSLSLLRQLGYRTFDHLIDNSYDDIQDNSNRFKQLTKTMIALNQKNLHPWYESCCDDIKHNQQLFLAPKTDRLSTLHDKLIHQLATS